MKDLYPTETARKRKTKEDGLVYCTKCGFPCRTKPLISKTGTGSSRPADKQFPLGSKAGKGVNYVQETITIPTGTKTIDTFDVGAGCPFCGAFTYNLPNGSNGKL